MGIFADLPYFEPEYLKEFYTPAKKHADKWPKYLFIYAWIYSFDIEGWVGIVTKTN